jgi:hypothetical protein
LAGSILAAIAIGMGTISNFYYAFHRPKVEELVKLDDLLIKLERRREKLKKRAGAELG